MFELGETVAGVEIVPFCRPLVGDTLAYVTGKEHVAAEKHI